MGYYKEDGEEYFSISEKILNLSDRLSEEIILKNIEQQLDNGISLFMDKINYLTLYKKKYSEIDPESPVYDRQYLAQSLENVTTLVKEKIHDRYLLTIGRELDFTMLTDYLEDMEAIYEFFYIRHFENLIAYIGLELKKNKTQIIERYKTLIQNGTFEKDVFFDIKNKKYQNMENTLVVHFIDEIIEDIVGMNNSAYVLFEEIVNTDPYEAVNYAIGDMLINYGEALVFESDSQCYDLYMEPLKDIGIRNEIRNLVLMNYLEEMEVPED